MKTEPQMLAAQPRLACSDAAAAAAILAAKDAQESQKQAQASRRAHQQDQVAQLKQAASKLKEMAGNALLSGIYQGALGLGSAACSFAGSLSKTDQLANRWASGGKLLQACGQCDPFAIEKEQQAVEKADSEAEAAQESSLAQEAGDAVSAHQRLQGSLVQQLQKIIDAESAAGRAAIKLG